MKRIFIDMSVCGNNTGYVSGAGEYGITIFNVLKKRLLSADFYVGLKKSISLDSSLLDGIEQNHLLKYETYDELNSYISENKINTVFFPQLIGELINVKSDSNIIAVLHDLGGILDIENNKRDFFGKYYKFSFINKVKFFIKTHLVILLNKRIIKKINEYEKLINNFKKFQLITVSHFSKSTIQYYLKDIHVIPNVFYSPAKIANYCNVEHLDEKLETKYNISEKKYFLFCNGKRERKNNSIALLAFDDFLTRTGKLDFKAVVLGSSNQYEKYICPKLKNKPNFVFCSYVDTDNFEALYKFAHLFVFPSILEGFGYPPVEAMKYGTLCACSSRTSIPEVCQNAVLYFDPFDIKTIELAYYQSFDSENVCFMKEKIKQTYEEISKRQENDLNKLIELIIA